MIKSIIAGAVLVLLYAILITLSGIYHALDSINSNIYKLRDEMLKRYKENKDGKID